MVPEEIGDQPKLKRDSMTKTEMIAAINYLVKTGRPFDELVMLAEDYKDRFGSWISVATLLIESDAGGFLCVVDKGEEKRVFVSDEVNGESWKDCYNWICKQTNPETRNKFSIQYCYIEESSDDEDDLSWITPEMFEERLDYVATYNLDALELMAIPGVRDLVREALNNEVIEALKANR